MSNTEKTLTIAIAGNPNCGKTLIFNKLTKSQQKVGNWAGVTVDRKSGTCIIDQQQCEIVDLPGIYSLDIPSETHALDEKIACEFLLSGKVDVILNVIDASNLSRHLYLTAQLLEFGIPMVIVLNMQDVADKQGYRIDNAALEALFHCPVISLTASKNKGFATLKRQLIATDALPHKPDYQFNSAVNTAEKNITQQLMSNDLSYDTTWLSLRLLEKDAFAWQQLPTESRESVQKIIDDCEQTTMENTDLLIADSRYQWVNTIIRNTVQHTPPRSGGFSRLLDSIVLNRYLGIPIFLLMMYLTFFFAINIGGAFQDFFDTGSTTIFIDGLSQLLQHLHAPSWLIAILANGLGKGINTVITFIPVIGAMFLFLAILEDSGYMARAAYIVDRLMQALGLPGKAFIPLIVGFGCNVPTVMAARTLGSTRDRILTVMMAPFMSCGARLAIYAVFVSAFFPHGGQNVIFALYFIGIIIAVLTGLLLRFTVLKGESIACLNELPAYHMPQPISILKATWHKLKLFLRKAGRFIIPICMLIGALNSISFSGKLLTDTTTEQSVLSSIGKFITPIFKPLGLRTENWPATVGLFSGLLAKEVVVGTLNTLYSQAGHLHQQQDNVNLREGLIDAVTSIPENLAKLPSAIKNPVLASAPIQDVNKGVYGVMYHYFDGKIGTFAYLLFILLYFPCVSTMAVMRREIGKRWANFSMVWSTGIAYAIATLFYQAATLSRHWLSSTSWIVGIILALILVVVTLRQKTKHITQGYTP
jgi:ferrous iron transport protein B